MSNQKLFKRFLLFCDKHQLAILNITLFVFTIASIILFIFHNEKHGCKNVSFSFDLFVTAVPYLFFLSGYKHIKICNKENGKNRRILTLIFLCYLSTALTVLTGYLYMAFVYEMSAIGAVIFTLPLIVFAIIVYVEIAPTVVKKAKDEFEFLVKWFFSRR